MRRLAPRLLRSTRAFRWAAAAAVAVLPATLLAQGDGAAGRAIRAFETSADVQQALTAVTTKGRFAGASPLGEPVAVQISGSCGVVGCHSGYVVVQRIGPRTGVNPQSTSVAAIVQLDARGGARVTVVDLAGRR